MKTKSPKTMKPKFKPLLYTTTMRNPSRMKDLLFVLDKFNGKTLTDSLATEICSEAIRLGLYRPSHKTAGVKSKWSTTCPGCFAETALTGSEVAELLSDNPQEHKEAFFSKGWPSRFATLFDLMKELGIAYFRPGRPIEVSPLGKYLLETISVQEDPDTGTIKYKVVHPEREQQVFLQALAKSQRKNPFVKVLNDNVPLVLLLQVIQKLKNDSKQNGAGLSRRELPLLLFWKNNDAEALYQRIVRLRKDHGYNSSDETICDICVNEIMEGRFKKFKPESIMNEYPDEFIRKMRMTGLISFRGGGRFLDINGDKASTVDYILRKYSNYHCFDDEYAYYEYMGKLDGELVKLVSSQPEAKKDDHLLDGWLEVYDWDKIRDGMSDLAKRKNSNDPVLRLLPAPSRLEFLTSLAIKNRLPHVRVVPNYPTDDTGLPTSHAGGDKGDIECYEKLHGVLVEVTMSTGRTQTMMEVWPIARHLEEFQKTVDSQCLFVAPSIFVDSRKQIDYVKSDSCGKQIIRPYSIDEFLGYIENAKELYDASMTTAAGLLAAKPQEGYDPEA